MKTEVFKALRKAHLHESYWGKKILAAENRGWFTGSNKKQARSWITCACGRLDSRIPRNQFLYHYNAGAPSDDQLRDTGRRFYHHILENNFMDAADCLIEIEARARDMMVENPGR